MEHCELAAARTGRCVPTPGSFAALRRVLSPDPPVGCASLRAACPSRSRTFIVLSHVCSMADAAAAAAAAPALVPRILSAAGLGADQTYVAAAHNAELERLGNAVPLKRRAALYESPVLRITCREPFNDQWLAKRTALELHFAEVKRLAKEKFHTGKRLTREGHVADAKRGSRKAKRARKEKSPPHARTQPRASPSPPTDPQFPAGTRDAREIYNKHKAGERVPAAELASAKRLLAAATHVGTAVAPSANAVAALAAAAAAAGISVSAFVAQGGAAAE